MLDLGNNIRGWREEQVMYVVCCMLYLNLFKSSGKKFWRKVVSHPDTTAEKLILSVIHDPLD